jgi:hypothetical protein
MYLAGTRKRSAYVLATGNDNTTYLLYPKRVLFKFRARFLGLLDNVLNYKHSHLVVVRNPGCQHSVPNALLKVVCLP